MPKAGDCPNGHAQATANSFCVQPELLPDLCESGPLASFDDSQVVVAGKQGAGLFYRIDKQQ